MALKGIKVIEMAGLAPAPFCGMILTDFGASVIRIDKIGAFVDLDVLANGKKSFSVNLKNPKGVKAVRDLCRNSDVLIEPFRRGVMEKLDLGPDKLLKENPKLIYARLTGFGQTGYYADRAGHDINYVAISGLLSLFSRFKQKPTAPVNLAADFGGGGLMCALGIVLALLERSKSGLGQVVDCNMVEGTSYLGSWLYRSQNLPIWGKPTGENILDSGAPFYDTYETKDGKYMAVGALEPQFFSILMEKLNLDESEFSGDFSKLRDSLTTKFKTKTRDEWCCIFDKVDACVTPVLSLTEAPMHIHNSGKKSFVEGHEDNTKYPIPAPKLSRSPGISKCSQKAPQRGEHTMNILKSLNYSDKYIKELNDEQIIEICSTKSKL